MIGYLNFDFLDLADLKSPECGGCALEVGHMGQGHNAFAQGPAAYRACCELNIAEGGEKLPGTSDLGCCVGQRGDEERTGGQEVPGDSLGEQ